MGAGALTNVQFLHLISGGRGEALLFFLPFQIQDFPLPVAFVADGRAMAIGNVSMRFSKVSAPSRQRRSAGGFFRVAVCAGLVCLALSSSVAAAEGDADPREIATSLARMLQSARSVISKHQSDINDEARGDKGLTADLVLKEALVNYLRATGVDPASYDPESRRGRLLAAQKEAIREVMDENQALINQKGVGFKGFIPATFARLVNEAFARRVGDEATVKVTAPPELVRNRKARPDSWEVDVIKTRFLAADWTRGTPFAEVAPAGDQQAFRMMVPEYYAASCLTCHGAPKGSLDITGYPREGAAENDLGGVISVTLHEK
jgi:cytochrome c553